MSNMGHSHYYNIYHGICLKGIIKHEIFLYDSLKYYKESYEFLVNELPVKVMVLMLIQILNFTGEGAYHNLKVTLTMNQLNEKFMAEIGKLDVFLLLISAWSDNIGLLNNNAHIAVIYLNYKKNRDRKGKEYSKDTGIPIFSPRGKTEEDKYEEDFEGADNLTGIYFFRYKLLNSGGSEILSWTISSVFLSNFLNNKEYFPLDIGCGVGRTTHDSSQLFTRALFIGIDHSANILSRTSQILQDRKETTFDLSNKGFGKLKLSNTNLKENVILLQCSALYIPKQPGISDCVTITFLIDRVDNPQKALEKSVRVFKPGGLYISSNPLNFKGKNGWDTFGKPKMLLDYIEKINEWFDGLMFRELENSQGNYKDWQTLIILGQKK